MKIRMLTGIAGVGFSLAPNEETERFSSAEAIRMIERGMAVPVTETTIETTTLDIPSEKRKRTRTQKPSE